MLLSHQDSLSPKVKNVTVPGGWIFLLAVIFMAIICFLPGLNSFGALDPTDSFFLEVSREMVECHHYITALFNYNDWLDKPTLPFWLIIIAYKLLGVSAWAGRLYAAFSGIILVIATYFFALRMIGRRAAILSAVILCTSPLFLIVGHVALSDEFLSMLFGISMLYIGTALATDKGKVSLFAYVFLGLAILAKGPIALVLALGSIGLYLIVVSDSWNKAKEQLLLLRPLTGMIILLLLCLPYYYCAHVVTSGAFTEQFFLRQNIGRMEGTINHHEPIWFYLPVFLAGYFPWSFYLLSGMPWLKRLFTFRFQLTQRQRFIIFSFCWLLFVAFLFTLVPTRLPTYIVPFSPALAIITAAYLDALIQAKANKTLAINASGMRRAENIMILLPPLLAAFGSLITLGLIIGWQILTGTFLVIIGSTLIIIAVLSLRSFWLLWAQQYTKGMVSVCLVSIFACAILVPSSFQWFYNNRQAMIMRIISVIKERNGSVATLFSPVPSTIFYLHHQVPNIDSLAQLPAFCQAGKMPHFLLASRNCLKIPALEAKNHTIASDGKWYLLSVDGFPWRK